MKSLFEKTKLGNMTLKNRFVRSATWENMTVEGGHLTEPLYDIYEELASNEVGLIITGYANVVKEEQPNPGMMGIYEDSFIEEYKQLTERVHRHGAKIVKQVAYGGTKTSFNLGDRVIFAPSEVAERGTGTLGKAMSQQEIDYVIEAFAQAGRRAKAAGFDGVEIHAAHTYLINQFLSPYYNKRTDQYGGSLENRMRFLVEIYHKMRELVGADFPILVKLTATEFFEGGLTFEDTKSICRVLEEVGVDAIELSGNIHGKAKGMVGEVYDGLSIQKEGYFIDYADAIGAELGIPVITVGGFANFHAVESALHFKHIDYFALSRPLLAEPDLIARWSRGDRAVAKCVRCSRCRTPEGNFCTVFNKPR